jgi:peptide/nickel transport system permease protein
MFSYILRRILYTVPILLGVMVITFFLFNVVKPPEDMARRMLGPKATPQAIQNWLQNRGYDKPLFFNTAKEKNLFDSQFFSSITSLAILDLGRSDTNNEPVIDMLKRGAIPSLLITLPAFLVGLSLSIIAALFLVYVRESGIDLAGTILCVVTMSVPIMVYVIFGQWLLAVQFKYFPAFGFNMEGITMTRFLVLPVAIFALAGIGADIRLYRAIFLEEVRQDYVRTAQAKGAAASRVLLVHVLKNGMIALITLVVAALPLLIMGTLVIEDFFGIPGLGNLAINAIQNADFAVVRADVYIGSILYLFGLLITDICYALVDPRIRLR